MKKKKIIRLQNKKLKIMYPGEIDQRCLTPKKNKK